MAFSIVPVVRQKSYGNQQKTCFGALFYKFSAVSFVGLKFNVYFCHAVYSYGYMKRIINCKSYAVSNPIRIYEGYSRCR